MGCRHLLPGTIQINLLIVVCTYLPLVVPAPLVLFYHIPIKEGQLFPERGVTLQLHWPDTANAGHVFTSRHTIISQTWCLQGFRSLGGPDSLFLTKLECWWVAHWWPIQIGVPIVVTNVSQ